MAASRREQCSRVEFMYFDCGKIYKVRQKAEWGARLFGARRR